MKTLSIMELLALRPWLQFQMNGIADEAIKAQNLLADLDKELWSRLEKKEGTEFEDKSFEETLKSIINTPLKEER